VLKSVLIALFALFATNACAQVSVKAQDIGEVYQTNTGQSTILFSNAGDKPVKIIAIKPSFEMDHVGGFKLPAIVAPKTSVNIPVTVAVGMEIGSQRHTFAIDTDMAKRPRISVPVRFFALSILDDPSPKIEFGTVNTNESAPIRKVALASREVSDFRIERVIESPEFATAKVEPDGRTLSITAKADASWGVHEGLIRVALNSATQAEAWIEVKANVHGDVIPSSNPIDLGLFRNANTSFIVQMKSRNGKPVKLGKVSIEGIKAALTKEPCVVATQGCAQIKANLTELPTMGRIVGKMLVELPDYQRVLPIIVYGWYLPESAQTRSLDAASEKTHKSSAVPPPLDLKSALQKSTEVALPPPPDPPGNGPLLKWQVSNESNVYGYMIYRGDSENGQFLRVNKEIIHVDATKGDGVTSTYVWRDDSATPGRTYWYYIGMINRDGSKQQLSGPQEVKAK
jgi:hypothetical protein